MRTVNSAVIAACLGLAACGDSAPTRAPSYQPGSIWDPDGDGEADGVYIDTDGDGVSDGIDTDMNGTVDLDLQGRPFGSGDGDKPGGGDGDKPGGGGDGDSSGNCEEQIVRNDRIPPDMLIVLDRSGSMKSGNTNRWDPSVSALKQVTMQLGGGISFGLMAFPAESNSCAAGTVNVPIGAGSAAAVSTALDGMRPNGNTPTSITLTAAHKLLGSVSADPDAIVTPKYVLLVTDGEPNCANNSQCDHLEPTANPLFEWQLFQMQLEAYTNCLSTNRDSQAISDSVNAIKAMTKDGIKTFVVGYDTGSGNIKNTMDMMAAAGGTGATSHIVVKSGDELVKALQDIAGKAASCTVTLEEAVADPSYVLVTIDDTTRLILNQPDGNGFTVAPDNRTVTIMGSSCDTLRLGVEHKVHVEVLCEPAIL